MNRGTIYVWTTVGLSILLGFILGSNPFWNPRHSKATPNGSEKVDQFLRYLDQYYVDALDTDSLATDVIQAMIEKLDPHSFYIPPEELVRINENMQGNFVGIGVSFFMINDSISVIRVLDDGPSKKADIRPGDRILIANQDTLYGKNLTSEGVVQRLRGKRKSQVNLTVFRPSTQQLIKTAVTRAPVPIRSVIHYTIAPETGYIKINRFAETTNREFQHAVADLKARGMQKMILDLRDNPGGFIRTAEQIADTFLSEGQIIVTVESNQGEKEITVAGSGGQFETGAVYVLLNGESASASEVVAGALQDNDRAWLLGQRSFGKGLVQQQMPLGKNEAIRLTTARYYTPTGRSIQRPYEKGTTAYYDEVRQRQHTGEIADAQKIPTNDTLVFTTPKGRTVFGGGGIVPDIYITVDETMEEKWDNYLLRSNLINHFVFTELDKRRDDFAMHDRMTFIKNPLSKKDKWLKALKIYLEEKAIPISKTNEELAQLTIKAYLALQLFDETAQLAVLNRQDQFVQEALRHLEGR